MSPSTSSSEPVQASAPVEYVVEPHREGGWKVTGGTIGRNGLWYVEARDASSYAKYNAQGKACRIELRNDAGNVMKVKFHEAEDIRGR